MSASIPQKSIRMTRSIASVSDVIVDDLRGDVLELLETEEQLTRHSELAKILRTTAQHSHSCLIFDCETTKRASLIIGRERTKLDSVCVAFSGSATRSKWVKLQTVLKRRDVSSKVYGTKENLLLTLLDWSKDQKR
jgi:hypothetical protein